MKNSAVKEMIRKQFPSCHSIGVVFEACVNGVEEFSVVMFDSDNDDECREFKLKLEFKEKCN